MCQKGYFYFMGEHSGEFPPDLCEKGITDENQIRAIIGAIVTGEEYAKKAPNSTGGLTKNEGVA